MRGKEQDHAKQVFVDAGKSIRDIGFICVYAIGPEHGRPLKIGYAKDLISRVSAIQCHNWHKLGVHTGCWVKELAAARELEAACHRLVGSKRLTGEWFDISVPDADRIIPAAAKSLGISPMAHDEMLLHVAQYRVFVKYPNLFWPNAQRLPNRGYAA
jgi:hypothetical protein